MNKNLQKYFNEGFEVLKQGGIIIFPTDTAFGIGCRVDNEESVMKVFSIRKRPSSQAVPLLISNISMAQKYTTSIPKKVENELIGNYWPGALTIILPANLDTVSTLVRGGGITVGLRSPNHKIINSLITKLGVGVIGPSANFHNKNTPYQLSDVEPELFHLVDYIIPGICDLKKESTVIDCSVNPWKIVRNGAIDLKVK